MNDHNRAAGVRGAMVCLALACAAAGAFAAGPSTQFTLTGDIVSPGSYTLPALETLPATTQTVSYLSGSSSQTRTYTGTSLWDIVDGAGIVTGSARNDVLNEYVLATASDGYKAVFSLGELHPEYGNRPDLVAYAETTNGISAPLGANGFALTTAPADLRGSRYVSNLASLDVRSSGSTQAGTGGGVSTQFAVSGAVGHAASFGSTTDWSALGLTPITQTVSFLSGSSSQTHTYTGYSLWDLINSSAVGILTDPAVKNDIIGKYVVATGSDGYKALFSMGELNPIHGGNPASFIALSETVNGIDTALVDDGFARIIVPGDARRGRYVANLASIEVFSAAPVPEPQTWALLGAGLCALLLASRRRGRERMEGCA
ncbi:MAG: PEP-CTERM sorting domain-containing protein [Candidatus Methylophosphatis roskildensis]